jgi:hypothetical protein
MLLRGGYSALPKEIGEMPRPLFVVRVSGGRIGAIPDFNGARPLDPNPEWGDDAVDERHDGMSPPRAHRVCRDLRHLDIAVLPGESVRAVERVNRRAVSNSGPPQGDCASLLFPSRTATGEIQG